MKKKEITKQGIRNIQINIVTTINDICEKNNIKYYLCGGSLLGAIRHKGFIPWDDDIDIMLLRDDYEKLIDILKKQKDYEWLDVLNYKNKGYYYLFAKAVDNRTVAKMEDNLTEHGIWVDIFPCDYLPDNKIKRRIFMIRNYLKRSVIMSFTTDFASSKKIKNHFIKRFLFLYSKLINREKFVKKYNKYCQKYNNPSYKYVGNMFSRYTLKSCYEKKILDFPIKYAFEKTEFYGPSNADKYLKCLYGNEYMKLPPEEKRVDHKIFAWYK